MSELSHFGASDIGGKKRQDDSRYGGNPRSFRDRIMTGAKVSPNLFFRVTSESVSVSHLVAHASEAPAPVPLPASALLLLGGIGSLAVVCRRCKAA